MIYKHIVFDVDGTLIDTEYAVLNSLKKTLEEVLNKTFKLEELHFCLGIPGEVTINKLKIEDVSKTLELWDKNMKSLKNTVEVFSGIEELLRYLSKNNYKLGIVTSKTKYEFESDFKRFKINKYFDNVICADDTLKHKPYPDPLLKYMEITNSKPSEVLYIGDTNYDKECAFSSKADFALALWGCKVDNIVPTFKLNNPKDLIGILDKN